LPWLKNSRCSSRCGEFVAARMQANTTAIVCFKLPMWRRRDSRISRVWWCGCVRRRRLFVDKIEFRLIFHICTHKIASNKYLKTYLTPHCVQKQPETGVHFVVFGKD
jgi:hypothetical protein